MASATCNSEWQLVMCSDIPVNATLARAACCQQNRQKPKPPKSAGVITEAAEKKRSAYLGLVRPDLDTSDGPFAAPLEFHFGKCTNELVAQLPTFSQDEYGVTRVGQQTPTSQIACLRSTPSDNATQNPKPTTRRNLSPLPSGRRYSVSAHPIQ